MELKTNWFSLLSELNANCQLANEVFVDLSRAYASPSRYYHNLNHIQHLLNLIESTEGISDRQLIIKLAAWFHDYIYDPQAQDNEVKSAIYAEETLNKLNISPDIIQSVKQIILSTQQHKPLISNSHFGPNRTLVLCIS